MHAWITHAAKNSLTNEVEVGERKQLNYTN